MWGNAWGMTVYIEYSPPGHEMRQPAFPTTNLETPSQTHVCVYGNSRFCHAGKINHHSVIPSVLLAFPHAVYAEGRSFQGTFTCCQVEALACFKASHTTSEPWRHNGGTSHDSDLNFVLGQMASLRNPLGSKKPGRGQGCLPAVLKMRQVCGAQEASTVALISLQSPGPHFIRQELSLKAWGQRPHTSG